MKNSVKILRPLNPFSHKECGEFPILDFEALKNSIALAKAAQEIWKKKSVEERVFAFRQALEYFEKNSLQIATDITNQMGKPRSQSINEVKGLIDRAEFLMQEAEKVLLAELLEEKPGFHRRIESTPLGVILVIAPWNYPLLTAINGVAAALLAGNSVLLKHSPITPGIGEHFAKAFGNMGGVENNLQNILVEHEDLDRAISECEIDHVIFTGSVAGGLAVQKAAANRENSKGNRFIDCNLELGGKDGAYIAEDADLEKAAADMVDGAMYNAGQSCCGIERVYVHEKIFAKFSERCAAIAKDYVLGNPLEDKTTLGPLARPIAAEMMAKQIQDAEAKGAKILTGGKIFNVGKSILFEPTVLQVMDNSLPVMQEENFGPILPLMSVKNVKEAIEKIRDSKFGLSSVIYTRDLELANRFAEAMDTGTVFLNRCDYLDPALPWTGVKDSGRGSSLSKYSFNSVTRKKSIHFRLPS